MCCLQGRFGSVQGRFGSVRYVGQSGNGRRRPSLVARTPLKKDEPVHGRTINQPATHGDDRR